MATDHRPSEPGTPPAYRVETRHLVLRPWNPEDAPALARLVARNQDHLRPWMPWADQPTTIDHYLGVVRGFRAAFDQDRDHIYGVFTPDGEPVGSTGLHPRKRPGTVEIGYWIDRERQGRGLVTEWCGALTRLALEQLGCDRVEVRCDPGNERSAAVPARLGFRLEGLQAREGAPPQQVWVASPELDGVWRAAPMRAWDGAGRPLATPREATDRR